MSPFSIFSSELCQFCWAKCGNKTKKCNQQNYIKYVSVCVCGTSACDNTSKSKAHLNASLLITKSAGCKCRRCIATSKTQTLIAKYVIS